MKIHAFDQLGGKVYELRAATLVIYDQYDNPIGVAVDVGQGSSQYQIVCHALDPEFQKMLVSLGVRKMVVCDPIKPHQQ